MIALVAPLGFSTFVFLPFLRAAFRTEPEMIHDISIMYSLNNRNRTRANRWNVPSTVLNGMHVLPPLILTTALLEICVIDASTPIGPPYRWGGTECQRGDVPKPTSHASRWSEAGFEPEQCACGGRPPRRPFTEVGSSQQHIRKTTGFGIKDVSVLIPALPTNAEWPWANGSHGSSFQSRRRKYPFHRAV